MIMKSLHFGTLGAIPSWDPKVKSVVKQCRNKGLVLEQAKFSIITACFELKMHLRSMR